jgi:hypothetical protein
VIRTKDGRFRSLFLWPRNLEKEPDQFDRNEQLIGLWENAGPEYGDVVAVELIIRTSAEGRRYGIFVLAVTRAEELKQLG